MKCQRTLIPRGKERPRDQRELGGYDYQGGATTIKGRGNKLSAGVTRYNRTSIRTRWTREGVIPSLQSSVSVHSRAKVIIMHTPSTPNACETHAQPVEKSIAN